MVLDMEGEFYKIAKRILGKPKNLYKMTSISPRTGRVTVMGAEEYIMIGSVLLKDLTRGKETIAYRKGKKCGRQMFNSLINEFDEEVRHLEPEKLFDLGLALATSTGWGEMELTDIRSRKETATISARDTIELNYGKAQHHGLTCGFLAGISSQCYRKDMDGILVDAGKDRVIFNMMPA